MDPHQYASNGPGSVPPLQPIVTQGQLVYSTSHNPIKIEIYGSIDKGFFLSDGDWTCYRRNYFSCICSFSLTPWFSAVPVQYTPNGSATTYDVYGYAMSISAVVADSDSHTIELVQHTPKRDKGPVMRPERVSLSPKHSESTYPSMYPDAARLGALGGVPPSMYENFPHGPGNLPLEHTFERIQFKQATANNGKRRAAQQYYHLLVELYAHVGEVGRGAGDQWMRIAFRKSAKMIVRGRSPGHYQSERRGSASSGPGGSGGSLGGYSGAQVMDYQSGGASMLGGGGYGTGGYDPRSGYPGTSRHHDMPLEQATDGSKDYQYFPAPIYDGDDSRDGIQMFSHRNDHDTVMTSMPSSLEQLQASRVKAESEGTLPSLFYPGPAVFGRACSRLEGKPSSVGYYPTMLPQST